MPSDYNNTLNLPKTEFSMRAGLPKKEPEILADWDKNNVYEKLMIKNEGKPKYILHDGPPYANGNIHLGTALNKVLKDFIIRYKNMSGFQAPFIPGWDTHGLPTELKARKKAGLSKETKVSDVKIREICRDFVMDYVDDQKTQFKRLGVIGNWKNPYITLQKDFEAKQIEIFSEMASKGYIYKGLKPVYWCSECETALAEAEIEYADDICDSIYVKFKIIDDMGKLTSKGIDLSCAYFIIWTTTTWTLPGNVAICVGADFNYSVVECESEFYIVAEELCKDTMEAACKENYNIVATLKGSELEYMKAKHPFLERESLVIVGDHVTLESGTGCVHTAPGHGIEDFDVCQNYKELSVIVPVNDKGILTDDAGIFKDLSIYDANQKILEHLKNTNNLFNVKKINHQYPHCWRCKEPVIFRATEQWFCSIDDFKEKALEAIKSVNWIPSWGEDRISSMVRDRKDWCISRQRKWGVPIPIFYCVECGEPLIDKNVMLKVADIFREEGSDAWFKRSADEILPDNIKCDKCGCTHFKKEEDIMDVWFDSGVTHAAVCEQRKELNVPIDLYLEGADQYRGWFQSSLLTSVATKGVAPYKTVVSHGWVVDGEGRKQSKSLGNGIDPQDVVNEYGADILRLWVASSDYHADVRISKDILAQLSEAYRKIRNTARYMLGNLFEFDPNVNMIEIEELLPIDKWALITFNNLINKVKDSYDKFEFHQVYHAIKNFCVVDMSNFYLDILKDRLYVESIDSRSRRAAQTAMYIILDGMTKLVSPILAYTSDEIWNYMPHRESDNIENVVFNEMPNLIDVPVKEGFMSYWDRVRLLKDDVQKALEVARKDKLIGSSLDAKVLLHCEGELYEFVNNIVDDLPTIFITSSVEVINDRKGNIIAENNKELTIEIKRADGDKCERCWNYDKTVQQIENGSKICSRCSSILQNI